MVSIRGTGTKKKLVLARIEDLWAVAESLSGDAGADTVSAAEIQTTEDQTPAISCQLTA